MKKGTAIIIALYLLISSGFTVYAQITDKNESFVYGVNAYSPTEVKYRGTFIPDQVNTIYLMAGNPGILSPRMTEVYFWPITNNYKADWDSLNEIVSGTLEIYSGNELMTSIEQTQYVVQYPNGVAGGEVSLYTGEDAVDARQEFLDAQTVYRKALWEYDESLKAYDAIPAEKRASWPEPVKPDLFLYSSTDINEGFPVDIPVGKYKIKVRDEDGGIVAGSEKNLVVFEHRKESVGYVIVPEDKYISPERSPKPDQVIYRKEGTTLYFLPYLVKEYNEVELLRYNDPQSIAGRNDRWTWLYIKPLDTEQMDLIYDDEVIDEIPRKSYWVEQIPGPTLGYRILNSPEEITVSSRTPDFSGFRIEETEKQPVVNIGLHDAAEPGTRNIRTINIQNTKLLYLLPVLPIILKIVIQYVFRKRPSET